MRRVALLVSIAVSVFAGADTPYPQFEADKIPAASYAARRQAMMVQMGAKTVAVLFTNPEQNRNNDVDFRFRPDSTFFYLSGCEEPDSALVLAPSGLILGGKLVHEILLVNDRNPGVETWTGYRMGPDGAKSLLGVEACLSNSRFSDVLTAMKLAGASPFRVPQPYGPTGEVRRMSDLYKAWLGEQEQRPGFVGFVSSMRSIKSAEEIRMLRHAIDASALGHRQVQMNCKPGMREWDLQAIFEYCIGRSGCEFVGYPSIVGSGPNSCILHYESDRRQTQVGDIVCMDAGGEYHGYSADVTRSFPVSGRFSPAQRAIYDLVFAAQTAGIAACQNGKPFGGTHAAASKVLTEGLIRLGIIKDKSELGKYFMHGTSHPLGLDVHDVMSGGTLKPGMVLTVEPGIYIKEGSPCDRKWWNIGVRIEDDILVTTGEPVILSAGAPRKAEDIEKLMAHKGSVPFSLPLTQ